MPEINREAEIAIGRIKLVIESLESLERESQTIAWANADDHSLDLSEEILQLKTAIAHLTPPEGMTGGVSDDEAVRIVCNGTDAHLTCSWPRCQCKIIPKAVQALLTAQQQAPRSVLSNTKER